MVDIDTHWTLLEEAERGSKPAVAKLCDRYRDPVEAFVRKMGHQDADDLAQGFFAHVIETDFFATAKRDRSKFRYYLRGAVRRYIAHERRDAGRQKRGGGQSALPLDEELLRDDTTPEDLFSQRWAEVILGRAARQLLTEYAGREAAQRGRLLIPFARRRPEPGEYETLTDPLGLDVEAIRAAVKRMRARYEQLVKLEVSQTVSGKMAFEEEYAALGLAFEE